MTTNVKKQLQEMDINWKFRFIPSSQLAVDKYGYQRKVDEKRVREIEDHYMPAGIRPLVVNLRVNPKTHEKMYYILDGQHRFTAVKKIQPSTWIPCTIIEPALTREQEAFLFNLYNGRARSNDPMQEFNARVESGNTDANYLNNAINSIPGIHVDLHEEGGKGALKRISPCESVATSFGVETLLSTLKLIDMGFGIDNHGAQNTPNIKGLARFLAVVKSQGKQINIDALTSAMARKTADRFYKEVKRHAVSISGTDPLSQVAMDYYCEIYNQELIARGYSPKQLIQIPAEYSESSDKQLKELLTKKR